MQELIKDLQNTAIIYCEDKKSGKTTKRIQEGIKEIIKTRDLKLKYSTAEEITARAYEQLENIYKAAQTKNIELITRELTRLFNIFTLSCGILTTTSKK